MKIVSLVPSEKVKGRWLLTFEDGTKLKLTDREMVDFSLYAGQDVPGGVLDRLKASAAQSAARRRAANILSMRPLSRRELEKRLLEKGETPENARDACDYMAHLGYLDDRLYAQTLVRHYSERGYGPRKLRDELYRRGVPREYWDEALSEMPDPSEDLDKLVAARLRRVEHPDRKELKRVSDALMRRGYSWSDISSALRRYTDDLEEDNW